VFVDSFELLFYALPSFIELLPLLCPCPESAPELRASGFGFSLLSACCFGSALAY